ncbi:hypothetical protein [Neisseria dentiae]|uniref:hypothetical protein n=1 Tax=Neisseria dentiae TaxID=194197 RepID=UPI00359FA2BA
MLTKQIKAANPYLAKACRIFMQRPLQKYQMRMQFKAQQRSERRHMQAEAFAKLKNHHKKFISCHSRVGGNPVVFS